MLALIDACLGPPALSRLMDERVEVGAEWWIGTRAAGWMDGSLNDCSGSMVGQMEQNETHATLEKRVPETTCQARATAVVWVWGRTGKTVLQR